VSLKCTVDYDRTYPACRHSLFVNVRVIQYNITLLLKYIHTIKETCFSYRELSSGLYIRTDPYLVR
jgi:hypothetical protein